MRQLDELNTALGQLLSQLTRIPAEDLQTDDLVYNLHIMIGERQLLLNVLLTDADMTDANYLQRQLELTQDFTSKAIIIMADRQTLLHAGSKNKRKISVYETIDSNR
uniref:Flagella biosynthesis chaperone for FliD, FliT n=1 Tax=Shewanella putrefaciens (strain 200) TaxID=399804 RepID=E6XGT1_SHEP2